MKEARSHLIEFQVKPSAQRLAIMKYLMEHATHPTVDTIYNDLHESMPTLSKTTIYNTLKLLVEAGVVKTIHIEEKNIRYDANLSRHAHFRCKNCKCIYDLPIPESDTIYVEGIGELEIDEVHLYYMGYCKNCSQKNN